MTSGLETEQGYCQRKDKGEVNKQEKMEASDKENKYTNNLHCV